MQELLNAFVFIEKYVDALRRGIEKTVIQIPGLVEQHIETQAKEKLQSSRDAYLSGLSVKMENYVLIVEMDEDNWLACAVEEGADSWNMNQTHLRSPKAKTSKLGYKYLHVPIGKTPGAKPGADASEKAKRIQEKINEVMKRPKIGFGGISGASKLSTVLGGMMSPGVRSGGPIIETQKIQTDDDEISGLYRTRQFANAEEYFDKRTSRKGMPPWKVVMFRTISENPASNPWIHPGIKGVNIFKETEIWIGGIIEQLVQKNIERELEKIQFPKNSGGGV